MMRRLAFLLALGTVAGSSAKWARPVSAPLARLLTNAEAKLKEKPTAQAHYLVGRLRSLAYASAAKEVNVYDPDGDLRFAPFEGVEVPYSRVGAHLDATARAHLIASIGHYAKAVELEKSNDLYWLGYAWMLEQGARWCKELPSKATGFPAATTAAAWNLAAAEGYKRAFAVSKDADLKRGSRMGGANAAISLEALDDLLRMNRAGKVKLDAAYVKELKEHEKKMSALPMMVTPVVFGLAPGTALLSIDSPKAHVKFDLDGGGTARRWSWITPKAAFLVWHPLNDGRIESGRELFGNATFWMFFRNGYDALAALDDNQDGELRGDELRFIGAWRDVNSNGVSDPGEVKSLAAYGITAIRVRAEGKVGNVWFRRDGVVRKDGTFLPTYDWIAKRK